MKNLFLLSVMTLTLTSFTTQQEPLTVNQIGVNTIEALQHQTFSSYAALQPTLADFYAVMDAHTVVYGNTLFEAKNDFALTYAKKIIPALHESFSRIIEEGKAIGIDWNDVEYQRIEYGPEPKGKFGVSTLTIVFTSKGQEHKVVVENALVINGVWKLSQFARLI
ncbi:MAG: hypothetical protein KF803_13895 [Cyclobacteriaceae bacterium]|nr:hypothetical protein [Cyclobacteriaceae bacterium]